MFSVKEEPEKISMETENLLLVEGEEGRDKGTRSPWPKPVLQKTGQIRQEKMLDM